MEPPPIPPNFNQPVVGRPVQVYRDRNDRADFVCPTCQKHFGRKEHLARHVRARMVL